MLKGLKNFLQLRLKPWQQIVKVISFIDKCVTQGLCAKNAVCSVVGGIETCTCGVEYLGDGKSAPGSSGCKSK